TGQHLTTELALIHPVRRSGNIQDEITAFADERFDWIKAVKPPVPEMLVIPCVFADGQRHLVSTEWKNCLLRRWRKVARFIEHIVGRQQHFRLHERHLAVFQQRGRVHGRLAGLRVRRCYQPADHSNATRFPRDVLNAFPVMSDERSALDEIAGRISAHRKLRKQNQARSVSLCAAGKRNDSCSVSGKIPDCGVDLAQRDLHASSLKRAFPPCHLPVQLGTPFGSTGGGGGAAGRDAPAGPGLSMAGSGASPGLRNVGAFAGLIGGSSSCLATAGSVCRSTSFSVRTTFWPSIFIVSTRATSSPTKRTKSTSCGGSP